MYSINEIICRSIPNHSKLTEKTKNHGKYKYNGVDRVENTNGYLTGNCVSCCHICNRAKGEMTVNEFYDWINKIHGRQE